MMIHNAEGFIDTMKDFIDKGVISEENAIELITELTYSSDGEEKSDGAVLLAEYEDILTMKGELRERESEVFTKTKNPIDGIDNIIRYITVFGSVYTYENQGLLEECFDTVLECLEERRSLLQKKKGS